jgi:sugar phosphate isomerase/epimerase
MSWYRHRLPDLSGLVSFHAPVQDLRPNARDSKIRRATRDRIAQCLDIAEELGIEHMVAHLAFNALAQEPSYPSGWAERTAVFWREVLKGRSVTLLLENVYEPRPEFVRAAVDATDMGSVGVCLDAAHIHRFSELPQGAWVRDLNRRIRHLHVSDNDQTRSQHLPPGQGTIDWQDLLGALEAHDLCLPTTIEVPGVAGAEATIEHLCGRKAASQHCDTHEGPRLRRRGP